MKRIIGIFDKTTDVLAYISAALILYLMVVVGAEIVSRKLFGSPLNWVLESSEHAIYVITLFGAAWLLKHKHHIRTDVVLDMMRPRNRAFLEIVVSIISAAFCLFLTYRAALTALDQYQRKMYTTTQMEIIMWPLITVMVIGFFLLSLQFIRDTHTLIEGLKKEQIDTKQKI